MATINANEPKKVMDTWKPGQIRPGQQLPDYAKYPNKSTMDFVPAGQVRPGQQQPDFTKNPQYDGTMRDMTPKPVVETPLAYSYNKTAPTTYDPTNDANSFRDSQTKAAIARLDSQRAAALSNLGAEQTKLASDSNDQRQSTSINSQIAAKNFAEYMAQRGQNNAVGGSGINDYANIARNVQYQGDIGAINKTEMQGNQDIARRSTLAQDLYNSGVTASGNEIDAQITRELIAAKGQAARDAMTNYYADKTFDYNDYRNNIGDTQWNKTFDQTQDNSNRTFGLEERQTLAQILGYDPITGKQTVAGRTADSNIRSTDANTEGQKITNSYLPAKYAQEIESGDRKIALDDISIMNETEKSKYLPKFLEQQYQGAELENIGKGIANEISKLNLEALPENIRLTVKKAIQDLDRGDVEIATLRIQNSNLDKQLKAQIAGIIANTAQSYASANAANASAAHAGDSASVAADRLAWDKDPTNPDNIYKTNSATAVLRDKGEKLSETDIKNNGVAKLSSIIDSFQDQKAKDDYLKKNKENIIREFGKSVFDNFNMGG